MEIRLAMKVLASMMSLPASDIFHEFLDNMGVVRQSRSFSFQVFRMVLETLYTISLLIQIVRMNHCAPVSVKEQVSMLYNYDCP
jgi:hypothetical protein